MVPNSSVTLPVEVMAHILGWTTEEHLLQLRLLSQKWYSAVASLMEGELSAQTSSDGTWKPSLRRKVARRLLVVCAPFMPAEVLRGVTAAHLSDGCTCETRVGGYVSAQETVLVAERFAGVEHLICPQSVTDTALQVVRSDFNLSHWIWLTVKT
jgi:hypothetical protein